MNLPTCHMLDFELFDLSVDHDRVKNRMFNLGGVLNYNMVTRTMRVLEESSPMFAIGPGMAMYSRFMDNRRRTWDIVGGVRMDEEQRRRRGMFW